MKNLPTKKSPTKRKKAVAAAVASPAPVQEAVENTVVEPAARQMWRARVAAGTSLLPGRGALNPLLDLPDEARSKLFMFMRECPYTDAVLQMLEEHGVTDVLPLQLDDFFQFEASHQWEVRLLRATQEAAALAKVVEKSRVEFSPATLAALEQEVFRQISSGQAQPAAIAKLGTLFLRVRNDLRADQLHALRHEKLRHELQGQIDHALEKFAEEVERHPAAREAFETLRREMAMSLHNAEDEA